MPTTEDLLYPKSLERPNVDWDSNIRPAIIVDNIQYSLAKLKTNPIKGQSAYIVGANQKTFEQICPVLCAPTLHFYDMRVSDLSTLLTPYNIEHLRHLIITWNTKVSDISPLSKLTQLETLVLSDTTKIVKLGPLQSLQQLSFLEFSGGIWKPNRPDSLEPIGDLTQLEALRLANLKIGDDSLRPIARCKALKALALSNQFATEEYAYLHSQMPQTQCDYFAPYVTSPGSVGDNDTMVIGRRKPFLNSRTDQKRLQGYADKYFALVEKFQSPRSTPTPSRLKRSK